MPGSSGVTVPLTLSGAARAVTLGATGTFRTEPASLPAAIRKLPGASSFTFAFSAGPATCFQTPSTRCCSAAPLTPFARPVRDTCFP